MNIGFPWRKKKAKTAWDRIQLPDDQPQPDPNKHTGLDLAIWKLRYQRLDPIARTTRFIFRASGIVRLPESGVATFPFPRGREYIYAKKKPK